MSFFQELLSSFIVLWAVIDPIGTIPVFIAVTRRYEENERIKIANLASITAFIILMFFLVIGEIILNYLNIPLSAFQASGGIILLLFALDMIFGDSKPESEVKLAKQFNETAIFPLAIPSIAGPGAILAIVLLTDNSRHSVLSQATTATSMLLVLIVNYIFMRFSTKIHSWIGNAGAIAISKVMGLILASIALNSILIGIKVFFQIK